MARVLLKKGVKVTTRVKSKLGFDNPANLAGTSKWIGTDGKPVTVYYDPASAGGQALAEDILANRIDDIMAFCDRTVGVKGASGNVLIVPGNSGAYHYGCDFVSGADWYEDNMGLSAPSANNNGGLVTGLVMAEVVESYMGLQAAGWNCGDSPGEALSRIFAETASGGIAGAMSGGFNARSSYDGSNWIDQNQGSDQDYPSIGCGMLYLDWVRKLGYTLAQITQAGGTTLAANYKNLTGKSTAWADFSAAVKAVDINATNPFNITDTPYPGGTTPPPPSGLGTLVVTQVLTAGIYTLADAMGTTFGSLQVTVTVPPGSYPIAPGAPTTGSGTVTVPAPLPIGTYSVTGVGPLLLVGTLQPGASYTLAAAPGATGGTTITIPPIVLAILRFLCLLAPTLPAPYGPLAQALCALLPAAARPCK